MSARGTFGTVRTANLAVVAIPGLAVWTPRRADRDSDRGHPRVLPQAQVDYSRLMRVRGVCVCSAGCSGMALHKFKGMLGTFHARVRLCRHDGGHFFWWQPSRIF